MRSQLDILEEYEARDRPPDPADEAIEKDRLEREELRRSYLRNLMASAIFREWIMGWLTAWGTFTQTFGFGPTGFPDRDGTMFKLGERSAGWELWSELDALDPEAASLMRREAGRPREEVAQGGARRVTAPPAPVVSREGPPLVA